MAEELRELAADYAAETQLSEQVCLDLLRADLEPPDRWRVDREGYRPAEVRAFLAAQKVRHKTEDQEHDNADAT